MQTVTCPDCGSLADVSRETIHGREFVKTRCKCGHISVENKTASKQMQNPFHPYSLEDLGGVWII